MRRQLKTLDSGCCRSGSGGGAGDSNAALSSRLICRPWRLDSRVPRSGAGACFNFPGSVATDGKRTRRRGLILRRKRSIATPGFDPESRVFFFRHFLATQLKTLDSGCHRSGSEGRRWRFKCGIVESVNLPSVASGFPRPSGNDGPRHFRRIDRHCRA